MRALLAIAVAVLALWAGPAAGADELRVGVFVGNNHGGTTDLPLLFATSDAKKMRELFIDYGGVRPSDATLLTNETRGAVQKALDGVHRRIVEARNDGRPTTIVFYYSGHGDEQQLHLGTSQLAHEDLRRMLENTGADVRVAILDACNSGGAVRQKGGRRGPSFDFAVEVEQTRGTAYLTSSAASEVSQESAEVGGGFFTHYLHTALLGAADRDRNGEVTLTEAYGYVHGETAFGTRDAPGAQTPHRDFDLVGSGELALTVLEEASAHLSFLGDLDGTYALWDESRRRYVAEVNGARPMQLALRPGTYYVHRRLPGWVDEAQYEVRRGETRSVLSEDFTAVAYDDTAARGALDKQVRRAQMPDLALRAIVGVRSFGSNSAQGKRYIPAHALVGAEARFLRSGRTWFGFDVLTGGGSGDLQFAERGPVSVRAGSTSVAGSFGFATRPWPLRAGIGGRAELITFYRSFPDGEEEDQASLTAAPGALVWLGLHHGRFSLDLQLDLMLMATNFDELDGIASYRELFLATGFRF